MDLPAEVQIHNQLVGLKGSRGTLVAVSSDGYYEVKCPFGQSIHRVLLSIENTVIIFREAEIDYAAEMGIER
jgi:phage FluMu protein Com